MTELSGIITGPLITQLMIASRVNRHVAKAIVESVFEKYSDLSPTTDLYIDMFEECLSAVNTLPNL